MHCFVEAVLYTFMHAVVNGPAQAMTKQHLDGPLQKWLFPSCLLQHAGSRTGRLLGTVVGDISLRWLPAPA
jgi:hypothetical protein